MRLALAIFGLACIVASISEYDHNIRMLRISTRMISIAAIYNPNGVKGIVVWGAGDDLRNDRPTLIDWLWRSSNTWKMGTITKITSEKHGLDI